MEGKPESPESLVEFALTGLRRAQKWHALARLPEQRGERTGPYAALPDAVFELLGVIEAARTAPTITDAAAGLAVDQPRASRLAAQALEAGLLRREADQRDGRRSLLVLTHEGARVLEAIRSCRRRVIGEATAGWTTCDRDTLARLLTRLAQDYSQVSRPKQHQK